MLTDARLRALQVIREIWTIAADRYFIHVNVERRSYAYSILAAYERYALLDIQVILNPK